MDFTIPDKLSQDTGRFEAFLQGQVVPKVSSWYKDGAVSRSFFQAMGQDGWFGFALQGRRLVKESAWRAAVVMEKLAALSPGVAVAALAHADLGLTGLWRFGSEDRKSVV